MVIPEMEEYNEPVQYNEPEQYDELPRPPSELRDYNRKGLTESTPPRSRLRSGANPGIVQPQLEAMVELQPTFYQPYYYDPYTGLPYY